MPNKMRAAAMTTTEGENQLVVHLRKDRALITLLAEVKVGCRPKNAANTFVSFFTYRTTYACYLLYYNVD